MSSNEDTPSRIYIPPSSEAIDEFAYKVCEKLGKEYQTTEIRHGFANFIRVVANIVSKNPDVFIKKD